MHMLLSILTYADDEEEALENAKKGLRKMCGDYAVFDYATFFDEEGTVVSGAGRWGDRPAVSEVEPIGSEEELDEKMEKDEEGLSDGWYSVKRSMEATKGELFRALDIVREHLDVYTNEELWKDMTSRDIEEDEDVVWNPNMVRHFMHQAGCYEGSPIFTYFTKGDYPSAVRTKEHLVNILTMWETISISLDESKRGEKIFVVPADVHY